MIITLSDGSRNGKLSLRVWARYKENAECYFGQPPFPTPDRDTEEAKLTMATQIHEFGHLPSVEVLTVNHSDTGQLLYGPELVQEIASALRQRFFEFFTNK